MIVVSGASAPLGATEEDLRARAAELRAEGRTPREVAAALALEMGAARNLAYRLAHE